MAWHYLDLADLLLAARLIGNQPLPDGNKRVGYLCAIEFVARNGGTWTNPPDDPESDETVTIIEAVAAGEIGEDELTAWIAERLKRPSLVAPARIWRVLHGQSLASNVPSSEHYALTSSARHPSSVTESSGVAVATLSPSSRQLRARPRR